MALSFSLEREKEKMELELAYEFVESDHPEIVAIDQQLKELFAID